MNISTRISRIASVVTLATALSASAVSPVFAEGRASTGLVGVSRSQSARLNASHTGEATSRDLRVHLAIIRADGSVAVENDAVLRPGQSVSLELPSDAATAGASSYRGQIRVAAGDVNAEEDEDSVVGTFEITNGETGETALLLPAVQKVREVARRMR